MPEIEAEVKVGVWLKFSCVPTQPEQAQSKKRALKKGIPVEQRFRQRDWASSAADEAIPELSMPEIPAPARARFLLGNTACLSDKRGQCPDVKLNVIEALPIDWR
ncbi:hypothetical protein CFAM422_000607 [Trichoderma lentiforme]|uniref:Uncharacterized protein n=1 Tax=Trichoderma lentiforme TaxID=1567552 RepID=A0A9P5CG56_9HYPO|nr:hypothetical protein CFAM422_000607 [Trichoderma lentiforme]